MKISLKFFTIVAILILSACSNKKTGVQQKTIEDKSIVFRVNVGAIIPLDDNFSLYYSTDGSIDFTKIAPIWKGVKGNANLQSVIFELPKGVKPTMLRIDLGKNQEQQQMVLKHIKLSYAGKAVDIPGTYIFSYFRPDFSSTKADPMTGKISGIVKNGIPQTPSLYPKEGPLSKQIEFLTEE